MNMQQISEQAARLQRQWQGGTVIRVLPLAQAIRWVLLYGPNGAAERAALHRAEGGYVPVSS